MDIITSVNNRAEVMTIPVIPPSFTVQKPQGGQIFETVSQGELKLIGTPKLQIISWQSFFPIRDYHFLRNRDIWGWDYVYKFDEWKKNKIPIRLIITETPINMAASVKDFQNEIKSDGDIWYKIDFEEFPLPIETIENEEDIDMEELEALRERVNILEETVKILANPFIYNYVDENMPNWAHEAVENAIDKGIIPKQDFDLNYDLIRVITYLDRLGLLK